MPDMTCLAEGIVVPSAFELTGITGNELVVGPTGSGKSFSNAYSRLLHTNESSVVVPIAKKAIREKFSMMFEKRGYKVMNLDFSNPENSSCGYDPLDYIKKDEDIVHMARTLVGNEPSKTRDGGIDPYWNDSATSVLAAEIAVTILNAKAAKRQVSFADVVKLHRSIKYDLSGSLLTTNIDYIFETAGKRFPGNQATELWKTVTNLAPRTASCIFSIVNTTLDKICSENVLKLMRRKNRVDFSELGKKREALFITTSPMNKSFQKLINLLYADMFRVLFETAEKNDDSSLKTHVHIICDDFACGSRIVDFEDYISIFRAAGISVTLLLQSESQLITMYGESAATTIVNNCDTYVYLGGNDIKTCENVSKRMNKPLHKVMSLPLEQVVVFRRGSEPIVARRYQTLEDPIYKQLMEESSERN